ncbi:dsDNA nuclease domain-containing protein [Pseudoalteromonas ardens]|uniref:CD-NTase associated protein 4-like DNA endonuclease domain-containing protein n=1 Tax=Pseudoalteromonas rubra TaxID=43658 RepID=A0A0L0EVD5_9GAMM|nr:dsDNA nuclease domain-containing protein [Pseudoalteromonas sp. R96]KNC68427.1 hypothetical protein AC626_04740 [Pseudoalteromonas rubra]MDK1312080.1 dsDNA nuclease domain-containing protein [Pseudoalteromonas sp. R96]
MSANDAEENVVDNPLAQDAQREKSGSDTHRKYNYQYHWALCRILEAHENNDEYALFVECHDDVVITDSLNSLTAEFEFNQVKETSTKHTASSLFYKSGKNSVLAKLLLDSCGKSFSDRIKNINLVSTGGFDLKIKEKDLKLDVIKLGYLADTEIELIKEKLSKELPGIALPDKLAFVLPDLPNKSFRDTVKGRILNLLEKLSPGSHNDTGSIYRLLVEDLDQKGEDTFDYLEWERALKRKAITSTQVQDIIERNIKRTIDSDLTSSLSDVLKEYGFKSLRVRSIKHAFQRYYNRRLGTRNTQLIKLSKFIDEFELLHQDEFEEVSELEMAIRSDLPEYLKQEFNDENELIAAVLYELLSE